ncbi:MULTISPECIES: DEAD/DEAH box helicase family protein [unclassified Okeania]|nr:MULTISPECIES: DEAD/DEAH box helicase family protein [unclassified Okeania]NES77685.1 DEAD/DEAH box helicase [Okeania sp. SIO1H4]NET14833.1 DEAD/DEAH box helicase [Okeania sp. SIO1H6]NET21293.1 DEAD/DEAH box helicase [Okeania sp. SIO1H5]NET94471.1 DEAD/DEAH box helicase [Okeania sp. SIO1H2]
MALKKTRHSTIIPETPEALFRDLRNRKIEGLLSHQADILREYQKEETLNKSNVALQLPTGSGKTLVGLLIGEWRRRKFREKVVYLCPTRQLVNQVVEKSINEYGIKAKAFTGKQKEYDPRIKTEYSRGKTLAVTTYSGLFNTNSFFQDANLIILDDAHAAENYVAKFWSILIERKKHDSLFKNIVSFLRPILSESDYSIFFKESPDISDKSWVAKIPTSDLYEKILELIELIDGYTSDDSCDSNMKYPWSVLRDHLFACHIYLSFNAILIRPVIPPTKTHKPFSQAKQRLYMSATLGEGGEIERLFGMENIVRLPVPEGWDKQGIGRRFFFFPESSLNEESSLNLVMKMLRSTPRSLFLVPDDEQAEKVKNKIKEQTKHQIFESKEIETSKQDFICKDGAVGVLANRYDGIDLPKDECRLLIVKDLQRATNIQEKFLVTRLCAAVIFNDRIITRMVQAVGRCTRSDTDYAAVVILGDELKNLLLNPDKQKFLHPELQAEIEYGIEQSEAEKEETYFAEIEYGIEQSEAEKEKERNFLENLNIFLEHGEKWNQAEEDIIYHRGALEQAKLPAIEKLKETVSDEVKYQYCIWHRNFEEALAKCESVFSQLNQVNDEELRGYIAFWYYLAGSAAWMGAKDGITSMESKARDYFKRAAKVAPEVTWFSRLARLSLEDEVPQVDPRLSKVIEGLEQRLIKLGTRNSTKFDKEVRAIFDNLNPPIKDRQNLTDEGRNKLSKKFEDGHERLGKLLGYDSGNSTTHSAPDPWWIAGDDLCIVFEDHSEGNTETTLGSVKVREAASHPKWIRENKDTSLSQSADIIPVLITPCAKIEPDAKPYTADVCYWNLEDFKKWATNAVSTVRELRRSFPGEENLDWRKRAIQAYQDAGIDPSSLLEKLRQSKLRDLPSD